MRILALLVASSLLVGCATRTGTTDASYFMISRGEASWVRKLFGTGIDYCKVTQSNLSGSAYAVDLKYDGDICTVEATATND